MAMPWLQSFPAQKKRLSRVAPTLEPLDSRLMLAVSASFSAAGAILRVVGDDQDNTVVVSRDVAGHLLVNGGAIAISGDPATVAATNLIQINGIGGNDNLSLDETNGPLSMAALFGGDGNDTLTSGSKDDFIDGGNGSDTVSMGGGNDDFQWNPGNGSDVVDGGSGDDAIYFNGNDNPERFDVSDSGSGSPFHHVRLTRDVGGVTMDLSGLETVNLNPLGGADTITINDQTATDLVNVNLDLGGSGAAGDGAADNVIVNGTDGDDLGQVAAFDNGTRIGAFMSLFPFVNIIDADPTLDHVSLKSLGGNDTVDASNLPASLVGVSITGGTGNDTLMGSQGDDTFVWNAGDGNDSVDGQGGTDTLIFTGSSAAENIAVSASGSQAQVTDDAGSVALNLSGVEQASFSPQGGADNIIVNNLASTALGHIKVKLNADAASDNITVNGSGNADTIGIGGDIANGVTVSGLAAQVEVVGTIEPADSLTINGLGGGDTLDASALEADAIKLALNGGDGADVIMSSQGTGQIDGGANTDTINVPESESSSIVAILPSSGDDTVNVNTDGSGSANVAFDATQRIGALNISGGGVATLTAGGAKVLTVTSLNITGTGQLNLNNGNLIVDYTSPAPSPIGQIRSLIASGFHGGAWDGKGIMTSFGNATKFALGYAETSTVAAGGTFAGQSVDSTAVVVKFTVYGDADLDGDADGVDIGTWATHFTGELGGTGSHLWTEGDWDYDGDVDGVDAGKWSQAFTGELGGRGLSRGAATLFSRVSISGRLANGILA